MLVAAAVVPSTPLLIPSVAAGAAHELDELRVGCSNAIGVVLASHPDLLVLMGGGDTDATYQAGTVGSLHPYGVDIEVVLSGTNNQVVLPGAQQPRSAMPLSLLVGSWLIGREGWQGRAVGQSIGFATDSVAAGRMGVDCAQAAPRVAMVVVGDGSAGLTVAAPRYLIPGAAQWQKRVLEAFAQADVQFLMSLTAAESEHFAASGRAAWQAMATCFVDTSVNATIHAETAPYGVGYFAASWVRAQ